MAKVFERHVYETHWVDKYNNIIPYDKMHYTYLRNSYLLALRTTNRKSHIPYLLAELERKGFKESNPEWFI